MGNRSCEKLAKGHTVLFAYEEAIGRLAVLSIMTNLPLSLSVGFMYGSIVLDKDGISSLVAAAEYATSLYKRGSNFSEELQKIYQKYYNLCSVIVYTFSSSYFTLHVVIPCC